MSRHEVRIGTATYSARKHFFHGTQRTVAPEKTLENITRVAPLVGLTRLSDITGLDRVGIPTFVGHRPNAPTLAVSAGKGFTTLAAQVSAGMEAVEIWHAENPRCEVILASHAELAASGVVMPMELLPLTRNSLFDPNRIEPWVWGWDLIAGQPAAVPYTAVGMGDSHHRPTSRWMPFASGSNGLAGGNHILEALAAALYEVTERDAVACDRGADGGPQSLVDLESITDPLVSALVGQYDHAGIDTYLFDTTVDTRVPTYTAVVADRLDPSMGLYRGYGAHLDPAIAMIRALTEAAQARLVLIAGSRDDYFGRDQRINRSGGDLRKRAFDLLTPNTDANRHENAATDSFGADINLVLERLVAVGLTSAVVVDLTHPELGIPVVRVIVPGLEGYIFDHYTPGPRALAHRLRVASRA